MHTRRSRRNKQTQKSKTLMKSSYNFPLNKHIPKFVLRYYFTPPSPPKKKQKQKKTVVTSELPQEIVFYPKQTKTKTVITSKLPQEIVFYSKQTKTKTVVTSELPQEIVFHSKQTKIKTVVTSKLPSKHFMSSHFKINKNKVHRPIETCMTEKKPHPTPPPPNKLVYLRLEHVLTFLDTSCTRSWNTNKMYQYVHRSLLS